VPTTKADEAEADSRGRGSMLTRSDSAATGASVERGIENLTSMSCCSGSLKDVISTFHFERARHGRPGKDKEIDDG